MDYKKILITGAEGQLGFYLYKKLDKAFDVLATSRIGNKKEKIINLDITNYKDVKILCQKFQPTIIINCAAITDVDFCERNKQEAYRVNVDGISNLIKSSDLTCKIIQISSDYIFDGNELNYTEESIPNPQNYYGKTKLESENLLLGQRRPFVILRPNTIFSFNKYNFLTWIYKSLKNNEKINVVSDQVSNPSYVPSISSAIMNIILMNGIGIYNHGSSDNISRYEFSLKIADSFNLNKKLISKIHTSELNQFAKRPLNSILNTRKIENDFNIKMNYIDECLHDIKMSKLNV